MVVSILSFTFRFAPLTIRETGLVIWVTVLLVLLVLSTLIAVKRQQQIDQLTYKYLELSTKLSYTENLREVPKRFQIHQQHKDKEYQLRDVQTIERKNQQ